MLSQAVFEQDRVYYAVDCSKLLKGDIILTTNPKSLKSWTIRKITKSDYSHAILCVNPPWCVESVGYGVLRFVISRFMINSKDNIKIMRLKRRSEKSYLAENAARYADNQVTREYAIKDAITSPFCAIPQVDKGKFFCSQLVAESYLQSEINLLPGKEPWKISPGDLCRSNKLFEIPDQYLREAEISDKLNCSGFLDGDDFLTPHSEEVTLKQGIIKEIEPLLKKFSVKAETYDNFLETLVQGNEKNEPWVPELDEAFANAIINSGLLDLSHKYFPPHHDYYFIDLYLIRLLADTNLSADDISALKIYYSDALKIKEKTTKESEDMALKSRILYVSTGLESVRLNGALIEAGQSINLRQRTILKLCLQILSKCLSNKSDR